MVDEPLFLVKAVLPDGHVAVEIGVDGDRVIGKCFIGADRRCIGRSPVDIVNDIFGDTGNIAESIGTAEIDGAIPVKGQR